MNDDHKTANVISALANVFIPGLGQLVQGRFLAALFFFLTCSIFYAFSPLILPLLVAVPVHIWSIVNAATYKY